MARSGSSEAPDGQAPGSDRKPTAKKHVPAPPAIADTAVNSINFGAGPASDAGAAGKGRANDETGAKRSQDSETNPWSRKAKTKQSASPAEASLRGGPSGPVPDSVRERFIQIGNNFYFPDGTEAFTDYGNRVTTRSENAVVIQSMISIARARAQGPVTVKGTDHFRKEAWFAARLVGLEVRGYQPTAVEQERLARAIASRRAPEQGGDVTSGTSSIDRREGSREGGLIVGRLVDHRPAHYLHRPDRPMSYYVRVETDHGDREIWGVDLERAFRQSLSTPGIGDEVGIRTIATEIVNVSTPKYEQQGQGVERGTIERHRNQWIVERKDFLDQRAKMAQLFRDTSVSATDAVKQHPELEGSYLQLQMGRALAENQYPATTHREQFVNHLRMLLARRIEIGQPLEPVPLRTREQPVTERERGSERDVSPTR